MKTLWSLILINAPSITNSITIWRKDELQTDFVSNNVTIKTAKKKKYWESFLIANLTSPRILLTLQKWQI